MLFEAKSLTVVADLPSIAFATAVEIFAIKKPAASFFFKYILPFVSVATFLGKFADTIKNPVAPFAIAARIFDIGDAGLALNARLPP